MTNTVDRQHSPRGQGAGAPPMIMVFRTRDGRIGHAWCGRPLEFQGRRAGIELDFYCQRCVEHVTLPDCILSRIPLGELTPLA